MSDIPRLAAELAERMEALGYSKGIIRIIRKCGWELEDARMRYGLSRRSLGKVIDRYAGEWRERWNRREVSHTRYAIRIKAVERMLSCSFQNRTGVVFKTGLFRQLRAA